MGNDMPTDLEGMIRYIANKREPPAEGVAVAMIAILAQDAPPVPFVQVIGEMDGKFVETRAPIEFPEGPTPGSFAPSVGVGSGAALIDGVVKGQFAARLGLGFDLHRTLVELGVEGAIGSPAWLSTADAQTLDAVDEDPASITPLRLSLRLRR